MTKAYDPVARRVRTLKRYGITPEQYEAILQAQDGRCAVCRKLPTVPSHTSTVYLHVDHDHKTGEVRGLLCYRCNHYVIGRAHGEAAAKLLARAALYLMNPPARSVLK